ncbi:MAG TPA: alpha/beta hydrolase, partial [Candidatus Angelobacter sp.]|nr:alpha/beta hydrolase [Candidatus Angelobacter sp.]
GPTMLTRGTKRIVDFVNETAELDSLDHVIQKAIEFNPRRDPRLLRHSVRHNFRQNSNGKWTRKTDLRFLHGNKNRAQERERLEERFRRAAHQISCPTLIVQGGLSDVFTIEDAQTLAQQFSHGHYAQVGDAGHTVQGDNPRILVEVLMDFLRKVLSKNFSART